MNINHIVDNLRYAASCVDDGRKNSLDEAASILEACLKDIYDTIDALEAVDRDMDDVLMPGGFN